MDNEEKNVNDNNPYDETNNEEIITSNEEPIISENNSYDEINNEEPIISDNNLYEEVIDEKLINNTSYEKGDNKKKITKPLIIITTVVILLLIGVLLFVNRGSSPENLEKQMKEASEKYFEKYMSINDNVNEYIVTLNMLQNANKQGEKYELKHLNKCKKQTTLTKIFVDSKEKKIKKIEVELNC